MSTRDMEALAPMSFSSRVSSGAWDNVEISRNMVDSQTYDGFHFDRTHTHTVEDHYKFYIWRLQRGLDMLGYLEIQLSQNFLNFVFD